MGRSMPAMMAGQRDSIDFSDEIRGARAGRPGARPSQRGLAPLHGARASLAALVTLALVIGAAAR